MNLKVPYLPDAAIEVSASALLAAYARREGSQIRPPVPVESILQDHLRLHLGFDDLRTRLRVPDVLGALYMDSGEVVIDQTLDPDEQPSALGRFRFTLAHEIGHWELHRTLFEFQQRQDDLFAKPAAPSIVAPNPKRIRLPWFSTTSRLSSRQRNAFIPAWGEVA